MQNEALSIRYPIHEYRQKNNYLLTYLL